MSWNSFGRMLRFTSWGESHGPKIGAVVDGCPPGIELSEADIQPYLDRRRPGADPLTSPRNEPDRIQILSGVFEGRTTGTPISLIIDNQDARVENIGLGNHHACSTLTLRPDVVCENVSATSSASMNRLTLIGFVR